MNSYQIKTEDLNDMLAVIKYMHNKIREGSDILGTNLDLVSDEMISELEQFVEIRGCKPAYQHQ